MVYLNTANSEDKIVVTLTELTTLDSPFYLFVFTHVLTKRVVAWVAGSDESSYPQRYNKFEINTTTVFADEPNGEWHYIAYQQSNDTNTNPALADGEVENGKMILTTGAELEYTKYNSATSYKAYNG